MNQKEIIISGVHLELTDALKAIVTEKLDRLFRHETHIIRIRVELEHRTAKDHIKEFVAKGHVELHGPTLIVAVESENLYKSVDELVDKLDRKLGRRARIVRAKRKGASVLDVKDVK
ncbi:MAG: ribosomal subunit interface protein [Verrucomicrobia bacterium GWF2_51_19]|nr:MAG: ribosomal subunit interface protein [Verrucomicrobia bacterium GWF2_51_19]HCJ11765.1 ribosome-associated translation inhibitor RaiA [Opitutae bacterium]